MNNYKVLRYFDDHLDFVVKRDLSKEDAEKIADDLNSKNQKPYTRFYARNDI